MVVIFIPITVLKHKIQLLPSKVYTILFLSKDKRADPCKLEIKSPYTLLKLSYLEIQEAEIKKFLHEYCQTLLLLIGKNKFAIGNFGQ